MEEGGRMGTGGHMVHDRCREGGHIVDDRCRKGGHTVDDRWREGGDSGERTMMGDQGVTRAGGSGGTKIWIWGRIVTRNNDCTGSWVQALLGVLRVI